MNWEHLRTFLWLRWRLLVNQSRRGGAINAVLMIIVAVCALAMVVPLFLAAFAAGVYFLPDVSPTHLLFLWDGLVVAFVFFWAIGLMTDLQRSEGLPLAKMLHLPVSVGGAFFINYVGSLLKLSVLVFVPVMAGIALALPIVKGPPLLLTPLLLAAFLLMITAISYQFQGWLASLMSNPRRRRTVMVLVTTLFVLVCQLPQLLNIYRPWQPSANRADAMVKELQELDRALHARELTPEEYHRRQQEVTTRYQRARHEEHEAVVRHWTALATRANQLLPIGWLPLGVMTAAEGAMLPAVLGLTGMTLLATVSLWRAYRTTLRIYQGGFHARPAATARENARPAAGARSGDQLATTFRRRNLLEWRLPKLSEPAAAVGLATLQSLLRAPEAKMMLLTPVFMGSIFGALMYKQSHAIPEPARPMVAISSLTLVLFGLLQIMGNLFGFDRDGFRVFVLCAARRRDILLGKNLAFAPIAGGMALVMLVIVQFLSPLRWTHLLAVGPQFGSMFLLFCLLTNVVSIVAPMPVSVGSLKAGNPKFQTMLIQMTLFMCLFPLPMLPVLIPIGAEATLEWLGWATGAPVSLLLSLVLFAAVAAMYRAGLGWQANLLEAREQKILETVTNRGS